MKQQKVAYIFVLFVEEARRVEAAGVGAPDIWHSVRYYGGAHNVGATLEKVLLTLLLSDNAQKGAWVVRNTVRKNYMEYGHKWIIDLVRVARQGIQNRKMLIPWCHPHPSAVYRY